MTTLLAGVVESFDEQIGLGVVRADGVAYRFHCIEIADGTRTIDPDTPVSFVVLARLGRREAGSVTPR